MVPLPPQTVQVTIKSTSPLPLQRRQVLMLILSSASLTTFSPLPIQFRQVLVPILTLRLPLQFPHVANWLFLLSFRLY